MATKLIGTPARKQIKKDRRRATDKEMTPLAGKYLELNPEQEGKEFRIYAGNVTPKGFLLLKCEEFSVMFPAGIELGNILLDEILPALDGKKGNILVAVLNSDNRFGADIGASDIEQVYYKYNAEEESFRTSSEQIKKKETVKKTLSIDDFGISTKPEQ